MSHPWMPQPYYGVRQARHTAPVPQPMGNYYTTGIFDEDVNMPTYMHEPQGVHGYYGLGEDACVKAEDAAALFFDAAKAVSGGVVIIEKKKIFSTETPEVRLSSVIDSLRGVLVPLLAGELQKGSSEFARGRDALIHWLAGMISRAIGSALNVGGVATALIENGLKAAAGAAFDKLININICPARVSTSSKTPEQLCAYYCSRAKTYPETTAEARAFKQHAADYCAKCPPPSAFSVLSPFLQTISERLTPDEERSLMLSVRSMDPTLFSQAQPGAFDPQPSQPSASAGSTALLVGAAAIAALFFLR